MGVFDKVIDQEGLLELQLIIMEHQNFTNLDPSTLQSIAGKCHRIEKLAIANGNELDEQPRSVLVETIAQIITNLEEPAKLNFLWLSDMT